MKNELQIDGYWWLPSNPTNKIAGTFHYSPDQFQFLKVFGSFYPNDIFSSSKRESPSIILGEDEKGNKITLIKISKKETSNISGFFSILQYQIKYCIKGVHLNSINDLIFNEIEFRIESLTSWRNYYPIKHSFKNDKSTKDFNLSYSASSEEKVYELGNEFEISINHRAYPSEIHKEEIIVIQYHIASIKSKENKSFTELLDKAYRFKFFLNMATVRQNVFLTLNLYSIELSDNIKAIELFFNQKSQAANYQITGDNKKYLFDFLDVEDVFPKLIKKWFSFDKEMMPIIHHLVNSLEQKNTFNSTDFLIIVQALEGYHQRFVFTKSIKTDLKVRLQALADLFSKEIAYFNDLNMQHVANTRNYYSHFYKKKNKIIEGIELYHVTRKLRYLLICCLLKEIVIEIEKIKIIMQKHLIHL